MFGIICEGCARPYFSSVWVLPRKCPMCVKRNRSVTVTIRADLDLAS